MTGLVGVSVPGCRVPMSLLERLSVPRTEVGKVLLDLRSRTGLTQLVLLSTCERTEIYAAGAGPLDPETLLDALADNRGLPGRAVRDAASRLDGEQAAHHLLRVTAGLESFVLGESDIVGQVRAAADTSRTAGLSGLELDRLMATAVNTSRRVHRHTALGRSGGSVAAAAVHLAATGSGGTLAGQRLLVVGAGHVANEVVQAASRLGATVTVCNRTRRHADRFAAAGATVVDLSRLAEALARTDVAIFGTAAPHRLLDATGLAKARAGTDAGLLVLDLCVPRNVAPDVHDLPGVRLVDLSELRVVAAEASDALTADVAGAESIVAEQLDRYLRWLVGRSAARSVQRLRADLEACAREELDRITPDLPPDVRALMEDSMRRTVRRLAHGPTRRLLDAAEAGDADLVEALAGLFATTTARPQVAGGAVS